jgi:ABC-type nitrate/sulfonate/bicarbonate transport system permease component
VKTFASRWWPVAALLLAWQLWIALGHVPPIVAPSPYGVAAELSAHPGLYVSEGAATLGVALAGLLAGFGAALLVAIATWWSPFATVALTAPALLLQATPIVAVMPILARVLGYDQRTVIAAVAIITFFPTFALLAAGLRALPPGAGDVLCVLGAGPAARLRYLALPSAAPSALVALRIAAANCVLAALIGEYLMGTTGLGRLFAVASGQFQTERAWSAALVATVLSVGGYLLACRIEGVAGERFRR